MQSGVEKKHIILFAILIAISGFTFESQNGKTANAPTQTSQTSLSQLP